MRAVRFFVLLFLGCAVLLNAAYDGYYYDQTTFSDGWVSNVKPDWVEATKGTMKVLLHYPNAGANVDPASDDEYRTATAWNALVAPRYSNIRNYIHAPQLTWTPSGSLAAATLYDNEAQRDVYVVLFRRSGKTWIEFVAPDKATFIAYFGVDVDAVTYNDYGDEVYDPLMVYGLNKFAVHESDLSGQWTNNFTAMQTYYNVYTGSVAGNYTYQTYQSFKYKPLRAYDWELLVVEGYEGQYGYSHLQSQGTFTVLDPWRVYFSLIESGPKTYKVYFSCIKNARLLWMKDDTYGEAVPFDPFGKSAVGNPSTNTKLSPSVIMYLLQ